MQARAPLSKEMQQHTYGIMYEVEGSHWWFAGRRAILRGFLEPLAAQLKASSPDRRLRFLDVGCGTGANLEMLGEFGDAEGVDISEDALEFCRRRGLAKVQHAFAEKLPYADCTFDMVTGLDVVEHLDDDVAGLREMHRVLAPGGGALLFVPAFMFLWGVQDDISNHRIRYRKPEIIKRLARAGLEVERATYANITFFAPTLLGRLFMRWTGIRPESENNINISALNGIFGRILGAERHWLRNHGFPFGVSIVVVARKRAAP